MRHIRTILYLGLRLLYACCLILAALGVAAQMHGAKQFKVKDNQMFITLSRDLPMDDVDEFTAKYNIAGIGLHGLIKTGSTDSLKAAGWLVDASRTDVYTIQKPMQSYADVRGQGGRIIFTPIPTPSDWRVVGGNKVAYGCNDFESGKPFTIAGDTVYFFLKGHLYTTRVRLAGNFTNWQYGAFAMTKNDSGWTAAVKLRPGPCYYKFIIADGEWTTDPDNQIVENDGQGNENSVFYVPNKTFALKGYQNAQNVYVAGTFNNWAKNKLRLQKTNNGWQLNMYVEPGTYKYEYYVDGIKIPSDQAEKGGQPLQLSFGDTYTFTLKGFERAKKVMLAGDFNDWNPDEVYMTKTADGWAVSYALGPGNYQYKFIVDGRWMTDPANTQVVDDGKGNTNSYLVISPNYTFRLKGFLHAKTVNLAGDFNGWSPGALPMQRSGDGWVCQVRLAKGKHLYKFLVDGGWMRDPDNHDWESDDDGNDNSVIWIE